jgi:hypothetical protein
MAITYVGTASGSTNNTTSMDIDVSGIGIQDYDVIIFFGSCDGVGYNIPTGFTLLEDVDTSGSHNNKLAYKVASSEGSSYNVTTESSGERGIAIFAVYRGVSVVNPIDQTTTNTGGSNTTAVLSSLTPTSNNSVVVACVGTEDGNATNPFVSSWPGSLTERNDNVNGPPGTGAASSAAALADHIQTTATAVSGNVTLSGSGGNTYWGTMLVSLNEMAATNFPPTVVLNTPLDTTIITGTQTPTLNFTGSDPESDSIEYNVQIDTVDSFDGQSGGLPLVSVFSDTDAGFTSGHPFDSDTAIDYTVQSALSAGTYYWRVAAEDPAGSGSYGAWSTPQSFSLIVPKIHYVQRGATDMGSATSKTVTLPEPVNTSNTWIKIWLGLGNSSSPNSIFIEAYFPSLGSSITSFNLDRYGTTAGITVYWQVISMGNIKVQHLNNISFGTSTTSISQGISTIVGTDKAFAFVTGRVNTGTGSLAHEGLFSTDITSTTNVDIVRGAASVTATATAQIVEFTDSTTVEHKSITISGTSTDTTLSNSVDTSVAFTIFTYRASGGTLNTNPIVELTSSTNLQVRRGATSNTTYVEAYVVNMANVAKELATGANITATSTLVGTTVVTNMTAAFTIFSLTNSGQGTTWANELAAAIIASTANDIIYKNNTNNTTAWSLQTVQLPIAYAGVKTWDGSDWNYKPIKVWNGTSWQTRPVKVWDGNYWITKG